MTYAQTSDVEVELGRSALSAAETAQWEAWLGRVERQIERGFTRAGLDLATQVAASDPTAADVIDVEVSRLVDKIQNPNVGQTSVTRSIDDASVTYRREGADRARDALLLTDEEWAMLLPRSTRARAFSIMPS